MLNPTTTTTQQDVLIIGEGALFDEGITEFLMRGTSLAVSHVDYSDEIAFVDMITWGQPDVILICQSDTLDTEQVLNSISLCPVKAGLSIFVVRLSNPMIDMYKIPDTGKISDMRRSILAETSSDFINILQERF